MNYILMESSILVESDFVKISKIGTAICKKIAFVFWDFGARGLFGLEKQRK